MKTILTAISIAVFFAAVTLSHDACYTIEAGEQIETGGATTRDLDKFKIIRSPVSDTTIFDAITTAERAIRKVPTMKELPSRDDFIADFQLVLRLCNQMDEYRPGELVAIEIDEARVAHATPQPLKLRMRTTARTIRILGDLQAEEAAEILSEFLKFPSDIDFHDATPGFGALPTEWALFQIGNSALPALQKKIVADDTLVRKHASRTARLVLGPRSRDQLDRWIVEADSRQNRERLLRQTSMFEAQSQSYAGLTLEDYRRRMLEQGRKLIQVGLRSPTMFPDEEREKVSPKPDADRPIH